ncbi:2-oxo-4-hydroxy-4-carboxy-5-ureidoimidazoline decarboxylase [Erwinia amylovora]|uniref:2-oxo-4-hydroxy-4-carboxy-5-ureidoimidazoline decarboxylase n=4 Tax=Erwinia amylovora TaxID=552 RepID=A0A831EQ32_ERWAM|nr:2-oxo-4-hydroxy-4-carboxy-5-ureidoimidazoline decarboxylase [Erwinia amylovora]CBX79716.1 Uricase (Urate oxidase) [Erwinia amylovora ATCC BAA-2158]CDK14437.1 Uricase (Urate oxidase) [Erwinia amylovora LA635]CDK17804.1 Uricase (Urate oxidase) [Erwinia amylovora LA636]CDK21173.1 Uricase (Urate oxidase) [Erwinia amylovora LA637]ATZ10777.1 OHCU decarboxylase [Erwinia amylovora]
MNLSGFNQASAADAQRAVAHCVALPGWAASLVAARPYPSLDALLNVAAGLTNGWDGVALARALSAHPRIGESAAGAGKEARLSRQEQAAVNVADMELSQALAAGNAAYEQRFGRVFLIRAKGRSGAQIMAELQRRLQNDEQQEQREAIDQLREITLLRLKESFW